MGKKTNQDLINAASSGDLKKVKQLIKKADVNFKGVGISTVFEIEDVTALMMAAKNGHLEVVKFLIKNNADVNLQDRLGSTALMKASYGKNSNIKIVKILLDAGAKIDLQSANGNSALHSACQFDEVEIAKLLVEKGANVNLETSTGLTPILIACGGAREGHNKLELIKFLESHGSNLDKENKKGKNALFYVYDLEVTKYLLDKGFNVNQEDEYGDTPFTKAVKNNNYEIIDLFIDLIDIKETFRGGSNALQFIVDLENEEKGIEYAKKLIKRGVEIGHRADYGQTAFMGAASRGKFKLMKLLFEAGVDINVQNKAGMTSLMYASFNGYEKVVKFLIENGAKIEVKNKKKQTALNLARQNKQKKIVKILEDFNG